MSSTIPSICRPVRKVNFCQATTVQGMSCRKAVREPSRLCFNHLPLEHMATEASEREGGATEEVQALSGGTQTGQAEPEDLRPSKAEGDDAQLPPVPLDTQHPPYEYPHHLPLAPRDAQRPPYGYPPHRPSNVERDHAQPPPAPRDTQHPPYEYSYHRPSKAEGLDAQFPPPTSPALRDTRQPPHEYPRHQPFKVEGLDARLRPPISPPPHDPQHPPHGYSHHQRHSNAEADDSQIHPPTSSLPRDAQHPASKYSHQYRPSKSPTRCPPYKYSHHRASQAECLDTRLRPVMSPPQRPAYEHPYHRPPISPPPRDPQHPYEDPHHRPPTPPPPRDSQHPYEYPHHRPPTPPPPRDSQHPYEYPHRRSPTSPPRDPQHTAYERSHHHRPFRAEGLDVPPRHSTSPPPQRSPYEYPHHKRWPSSHIYEDYNEQSHQTPRYGYPHASPRPQYPLNEAYPYPPAYPPVPTPSYPPPPPGRPPSAPYAYRYALPRSSPTSPQQGYRPVVPAHSTSPSRRQASEPAFSQARNAQAALDHRSTTAFPAPHPTKSYPFPPSDRHQPSKPADSAPSTHARVPNCDSTQFNQARLASTAQHGFSTSTFPMPDGPPAADQVENLNIDLGPLSGVLDAEPATNKLPFRACQGYTSKDKPCRNRVLMSELYCRHHQNRPLNLNVNNTMDSSSPLISNTLESNDLSSHQCSAKNRSGVPYRRQVHHGNSTCGKHAEPRKIIVPLSDSEDSCSESTSISFTPDEAQQVLLLAKKLAKADHDESKMGPTPASQPSSHLPRPAPSKQENNPGRQQASSRTPTARNKAEQAPKRPAWNQSSSRPIPARGKKAPLWK